MRTEGRVRVWYHVYASPVHPEMCDNWLLKAYSNFIMMWEACCVHVKHEMDNQDPDHCYVTDRKWWTRVVLTESTISGL